MAANAERRSVNDDDSPWKEALDVYLKAQETQGNSPSRFGWKMRLVKGLYDRRLGADQIRRLFRFIDWMMELPNEMEKQFSEQLHQFEQEKHIPYVTSVERLAREQGIHAGVAQGLLEGIETVVEFRFGDSARPILEEIRKLTSIDTLRTVLQRAKTVERAEELRAWLSDQDERK